MITANRYKVGQKVRVSHPYAGEWTGVITYVADVSNGFEPESQWEYEVSNAPEHNKGEAPGREWIPLLWEAQIIGLIS